MRRHCDMVEGAWCYAVKWSILTGISYVPIPLRYTAENRYCTILVTVQWCQYFDNIYDVMDSDMRENLEHLVDVGVTVIDHDMRSDLGV